MKFSHTIKVLEPQRLEAWDKVNGLKCKVVKSGLKGGKSKIIVEDGIILQIPTDWLIPIDYSCKCDIRILMHCGCKCGGD